MSFIVDGKKWDVPGLTTVSWLDGNKNIKEITDFSARSKTIRLIVAHTNKGIKGKLLPGVGPNSTVDESLARYQTNTDRQVSWDFTVDYNGDVICQNDVTKKYSWQAGNINPVSCGFEMCQLVNGDVYESEIEKAVLMIDFLTAVLGVQRQIPWDLKNDCPRKGILTRLQMGNGVNVVGIVGHFMTTRDRGFWDPGPYLFEALKKAGYMLFDYENEDDLAFWKTKQKELGFKEEDCDGIPLKKTVAALKATGHKNGILVKRSIDDLIMI